MNDTRMTGGYALLVGIILTILIILLALIGAFPAGAQEAQEWEDWGLCETETVVNHLYWINPPANLYTIIAHCEDWLTDENPYKGNVRIVTSGNQYTITGCLSQANCADEPIPPTGNYLYFMPVVHRQNQCWVSLEEYSNGNSQIAIVCQSNDTWDHWYNFLWDAEFYEDGSFVITGELPDL